MGYTVKLLNTSKLGSDGEYKVCTMPFNHECEGDGNYRIGGSSECYISSLTYNYARNAKVEEILRNDVDSGFSILDGKTARETLPLLRKLLDSLDRNADWDVLQAVFRSESNKDYVILRDNINADTDTLQALLPKHSKNWIEYNKNAIRTNTYPMVVVDAKDRGKYFPNELLGYWSWCDANVWRAVKQLINFAEYNPDGVWEIS